DASLQLDQAASIQRRVTTCGGRRKTQPTVRDGLTTTSSQLCLLAGWPGEGKLGVHNLLENYLKVADQACEMAAEATDQDWKSESGVLDWSKVEHTFAEMDKALLATAFQLSQLIEHIAQAAG
ncbi:TPA: hypothetical protein ACVGJ1_005737, partial [Pseudomonas aeruginosa]|uniref:hypothetical protein n=1 Tax=Pseudomonas aeruginosa TaxID=287 RepID=UPI0032E45E6B